MTGGGLNRHRSKWGEGVLGREKVREKEKRKNRKKEKKREKVLEGFQVFDTRIYTLLGFSE